MGWTVNCSIWKAVGGERAGFPLFEYFAYVNTNTCDLF